MLATATTQRTEGATEAFFDGSAFYVQEYRGTLKANNQFAIWDGTGRRVGSLRQRISLAGFFWRFFLKSSVLPFHIELADCQGRVQAAIRRGSTFFASGTEVLNGRGDVIGFLKAKYRARKPSMKVFNADGKKIGEIAGTQGGWDMDIIDRDYGRFGSIREFERGSTPGETAGQETYLVELDRQALSRTDCQVILTIAIAVDRLILENG